MTADTKQIGAFSVKDAGKGLVEAVFSTFNVKDKQGDLTLPGAFEPDAEVMIGAYGHRTWFGEPPVGKGVISRARRRPASSAASSSTRGEAPITSRFCVTSGRCSSGPTATM